MLALIFARPAVISFQQLLDTAFPTEADLALVRSVTNGILLADSVQSSEAFLGALVGRDLTGHIRRAAILYSMDMSCKSGDLPFESTMTKMPLGGGHWVELRSENFRAQICRTDHAAAFPTDTPTRQDQRLSNQLDLFAIDSNVTSIRSPIQMELYAWLTFGANGNQLTHLAWGMPKSGRDEWLARTNVLTRLGEAGVDVVDTDAPSRAVKLQFRDHIEEALRRQNENAGADQVG